VNELVLFKQLEADHAAIWKLLNEITGGSGQTEATPSRQHTLAQRIVALQSAHELAEEVAIWPEVTRRCLDGDELVQTALSQEHELKLALNELDHISAGTEEFAECVHTVCGQERTHLTYEQNQIWPRLYDQLSAADAGHLEARWSAVRRTAPTKPHPHLPARAELLVIMAAADRLVRGARDRRRGNGDLPAGGLPAVRDGIA
jgi:hemerythrin superfamily protein